MQLYKLDTGGVEHLGYLGVCCVIFFSLRFVLTRTVFKPFAARVLKENTANNQRRFAESAWYSVYYPLSLAAGLYILFHEGFSEDFCLFYENWPHVPLSDIAKLYYMAELAFYVEGLFSLLFIEKRKKDFYEMLGHHVVTIILISISFLSHYHRFGIVVLIVHDVSDCFLYVGKCFNVAGSNKIRDLIFVFFAASFFVTRLVFYPFKVIQTAYRECGNAGIYQAPSQVFWKSDPVAIFEIGDGAVCVGPACVSAHWFLTYLMTALVFLHIFWFFLIVRMIIKALREATVDGDIRSDSEGEEPTPKLTPKPKAAVPTPASTATAASASGGDAKKARPKSRRE